MTERPLLAPPDRAGQGLCGGANAGAPPGRYTCPVTPAWRFRCDGRRFEPRTQEGCAPDGLRTQLKAEIDRWTPIIRKAGVYAD